MSDDACSRCGWDMAEELAEGYATASTSMHWPGGVLVCGRCLGSENLMAKGPNVTSEIPKEHFCREYITAGGRKIRGLTLAGFNLVRSMVGLPEVAPSAWLAMTADERHEFRSETLMRATPELAAALFGPSADLENCPIDEGTGT